jgi:hypothetical protein
VSDALRFSLPSLQHVTDLDIGWFSPWHDKAHYAGGCVCVCMASWGCALAHLTVLLHLSLQLTTVHWVAGLPAVMYLCENITYVRSSTLFVPPRNLPSNTLPNLSDSVGHTELCHFSIHHCNLTFATINAERSSYHAQRTAAADFTLASPAFISPTRLESVYYCSTEPPSHNRRRSQRMVGHHTMSRRPGPSPLLHSKPLGNSVPAGLPPGPRQAKCHSPGHPPAHQFLKAVNRLSRAARHRDH